MWNKIQIKVWIDRHVKTHEKKPSHENQVKKVKSAAGFGIFVREKSVRVRWTNICVMNTLKHSILPLA